MEDETIRIEDHPLHWRATLLGEDFWKDAEEYQRTSNDIDDHDQIIHTRFPFKIGSDQNLRSQAASTNSSVVESVPDNEHANIQKTHRRRFSMSDALGLPFTRTSRPIFGRPTFSITLASDDEEEQEEHAISEPRRARSQSRAIFPKKDVERRRSNSLLRRSLHRMSFLRREKSSERITRPPSPVLIPADQATPAKPLMSFRGGDQWDTIPKDRRVLGLDVFWPIDLTQESDDDDDGDNDDDSKQRAPTKLPVEEMASLCVFRNLRVLKLTGMLHSYQQYIWQAAWLNTNLEELELDMALPPRYSRTAVYKWPFMKGGWQMSKAHYGEPVYYGQNGTGTLDPNIGWGEYLDKLAIEKAKVRAMATGRTLNRLSIKTLVLTGFVVDADPFLHWFDPQRLQCVNFKDDCVDAGFYLCRAMKKVIVRFPRRVEGKMVFGRWVDLKMELRVVEIGKGGSKDRGRRLDCGKEGDKKGRGEERNRRGGHDHKMGHIVNKKI
ncbi:hypothetical protein P168DRAFT_243518 [Aspergillus campestris IBT 28561]|uniref:Uncharacterized protein n=1 Tax=Aspergillus campestris (strain IBT 28561) TaxID=1392248 RepID=A0A2I1CSA5_ASPC2|nr:uncharacterized protein P168DRAFT_243518 [Aspergillus campestris IBT 28561]PKY00502.1 hypothetical protein P168DRAFT_243518 [Aspergillus campestris IBT 28561]